jgi:hypothetical protein
MLPIKGYIIMLEIWMAIKAANDKYVKLCCLEQEILISSRKNTFYISLGYLLEVT